MRLRRYLAAGALAVAVPAATMSTAPADAMDSYCRKVGAYSTNWGYNSYIPAAGFGWTAWRVNPTVTVWDRCNHGRVDLTVNLYRAAVITKPGGLLTVQVSYYIQGRGWIAAQPMVNRTPSPSAAWLTFTHFNNHVDMTNSSRITAVRFVSTVWTNRNAGSGWVGLVSKTLTLNTVNPSWSST